jgi:integrase/recombinase XerD
MNGGSLSANAINNHVTAIRRLGKYLQLTGKASFTIKPELLKVTETATFLTREEIRDLYKVAGSEDNIYNQRDTAMLSLFYGCGLRSSEGEALNVGDILFEKDLVYVRKGKGYRERYVPINPQAKRNLKEYIRGQRKELLQGNKTEALLLGRRGTRWAALGMYQRLRWLKMQTNNDGLKQKTFGMHILRHSIATHLLQSGMKLEHISRFLGHKSLETTQKYTHLANEEMNG